MCPWAISRKHILNAVGNKVTVRAPRRPDCHLLLRIIPIMIRVHARGRSFVLIGVFEEEAEEGEKRRILRSAICLDSYSDLLKKLIESTNLVPVKINRTMLIKSMKFFIVNMDSFSYLTSCVKSENYPVTEAIRSV
jgi:hypothetical protein